MASGGSRGETTNQENAAKLVTTCIQAFSGIISACKSGSVPGEILMASQWEDQLGRFRVCSASIGADQTGLFSLEHRLRDDSDIQGQVLRILRSLHKLLQSVPTMTSDTNINDHPEPQQITLADDDQAEPERSIELASNHICCLSKMDMLTRRPPRSDFLHGSDSTFMRGLYPMFLNTLKTKYPTAKQFLLVRLAWSSSWRQAYLRYRRRHPLRLSHNLDQDAVVVTDEELPENDGMTAEMDFSPHIDAVHPPLAPETVFTPSSYDPSGLALPRRPRDVTDQDLFECPYCFCTVRIVSEPTWAEHVFDDLRPYICTEMVCERPKSTYTSRNQWEYHLSKSHSLHISERSQEFDGACPLCEDSGMIYQTWLSHIARHLEEIAFSGSEYSEEQIDDTVEHDLTEARDSSMHEIHHEIHPRPGITVMRPPVANPHAVYGSTAYNEEPDRMNKKPDRGLGRRDLEIPRGANGWECGNCNNGVLMKLDFHMHCLNCARRFDAYSRWYDRKGEEIKRS